MAMRFIIDIKVIGIAGIISYTKLVGLVVKKPGVMARSHWQQP